MKERALVIFSGGQDSTTCLFWAKNRYQSVEAITFKYGQRHSIELQQAQWICKELEVPQTLFEIPLKDISSSSALLDKGLKIEKPQGNNFPTTMVDGRNILMLLYGAIFAKKNQIKDIIIGVCETDYSGYPDCRNEFIESFEKSLCLGMEYDFKIYTPLMYLKKSETFLMAKKERGLEFIVEHSHTCYQGDRNKKWDWGYGCNSCPACLLRKKGWEEFLKL